MNQRLRNKALNKYEEHVSRLRVTRQSKLNYVTCEFPRSEWYRKSVVYQGPRYWEILPSRLKNIGDILEFKKEIIEYYTLMFNGEGFV